MKSLLYQDVAPFTDPVACSPCREEATVTLRSGNRFFHVTVRDKVLPEDPYLVMVKAAAFSIQNSEPYNAQVTPRALRDVLIKENLVI